MMSLHEFDRICCATVAGRFGVRILPAHVTRSCECWPIPANVTSHPDDADASTTARRGLEQGNY
jgi:hypothetical protein